MTRAPLRRPVAVLAHLLVMAVVSAVLGLLVAGLAVPVAGLVGLGAQRVAESTDDLPTALDVQPLAERSTLLDREGRVIATLYDQNRVSVPLRRVSRTMVEAMLAVEDARFYEHGPIDVRGTLRALLTNLAGEGDSRQGGSSITQQLVKQTLVLQASGTEERADATQQTYGRKLRELRYAIALEQTRSKDWILERYLNTVYFGDGAYGVQVAAQHYFGVDAADLDAGQAAVLAGLVKNPTGYAPTSSPQRARARRDVVLDRMVQVGVLGERRAARLQARGLQLDPQPVATGCLASTVPLFCDYTVRYLLQDPRLGRTERQREHLLETGGLTVRTTVDLDLQRAAEDAVAGGVLPAEEAVGALAMVEPGTGEVRAIAQSRPFGAGTDDGETSLNYAVNQRYGGARGFQGGSTFKTIVLATALEQGMAPTESIDSPPSLTLSESEFEDCDGEPYGYGSWTVGNSTTSGTKTAYQATRESVNTFFAQLQARTGLCEPFELARSMGMDLDDPTGGPDGLGAERVPTFTLGTPNVSPLEMAEAYATFAAQGLHCDARPVSALDDRLGTRLARYAPDCDQVVSTETADVVNDILRGVLEGGVAGAQQLAQPAAGKTGNNEGLSVWFAGYTPNLSTAAMVAGADEAGSPLLLQGRTVGGVVLGSPSGSGLAAPIWGDAMRAATPLLDDVDFTAPSE